MRDEPTAFNAWLHHDLRQQYDHVLREPVPQSLAALLAVPPND